MAMETLSTLLALCLENPLMIGGFLSKRAFDNSFVVSLKKLLNKQLSCRLCEMPYLTCDVTVKNYFCSMYIKIKPV